MALQNLAKRLGARELDDDLQKLVKKLTTWRRDSHAYMQERYPDWDKATDMYYGVGIKDGKQQKNAKNESEPEKFVVPIGAAQVNTFAAFNFLLFKQNGKLYEFGARGDEDFPAWQASETILERDGRKNKLDSELIQNLIDVPRYGMGVFKHWWAVETADFPMMSAPSTPKREHALTSTMNDEATTTQVVTYEGNRVETVSPYNIFPDVRKRGLAGWDRGEYVADESEYTRSELQSMQAKGEVFGIKYVKSFEKQAFTRRGDTRLRGFKKAFTKKGSVDELVCVTAYQAWIIPKEFKLGDEQRPMMHLIWLANDERPIRIERLGYAHCSFNYDIACFLPDQQRKLGLSLVEQIYELQNVITWLINSRIMSIRQGLDKHLVVDPNAIDPRQFANRSPIIYTRESAGRTGIDRFIKQLDYADPTGSNFGDAGQLMEILKMVTGITDNVMGQSASGRRSATEMRSVTSNAAGRMKMHSSLIWSMQLGPMGNKLLTNNRQALSRGTFEKILGTTTKDIEEIWGAFNATPQDLIGNEDFFPFDSTMESEKGFIAQSLQELALGFMQNPEILGIMQQTTGEIMNPVAIIEEVYRLRGVTNLGRFKMQPPGMPQQPQQLPPQPEPQPV